MEEERDSRLWMKRKRTRMDKGDDGNLEPCIVSSSK